MARPRVLALLRRPILTVIDQCTTRLTMNMITKSRNPAIATLDDPRWVAVVARDAKADGQFFYSVRTTGVYCRPSCAARTPRPENVAFHVTAIDAQRAGFRACLRCKPDEPSLATRHPALVA